MLGHDTHVKNRDKANKNEKIPNIYIFLFSFSKK